MANISEVSGKMYLEKDFYINHKDWIESLTETHGDYGFWNISSEPGAINEDEVEFHFEACGKWCFLNNTMESNYCWNPTENHLFDKMLDSENPKIEMEFIEYEPGCEIFWDADAVVQPAQAEGNKVLSFNIEELDLSDANRVRFGFEEEAFSFEDINQDYPDVMELFQNASKECPDKYTDINDFAEKLKKRISKADETKGVVSEQTYNYWLDCIDVLIDFLEE